MLGLRCLSAAFPNNLQPVSGSYQPVHACTQNHTFFMSTAKYGEKYTQLQTQLMCLVDLLCGTLFFFGGFFLKKAEDASLRVHICSNDGNKTLPTDCLEGHFQESLKLRSNLH